MISIVITNQKVGKSVLFSEQHQKGRKKSVPTYRMFVTNEAGSVKEFEVTRDTIVTAFGEPTVAKYGTNDEAPPNKTNKPYHAHIRTDGPRGFRLEFFEPGIGPKRNRFAIQGIGKVVRFNIQIHYGPARSEGCFFLKGGKLGMRKFEQAVRRMIQEDEKAEAGHPDEFRIRIHKR